MASGRTKMAEAALAIKAIGSIWFLILSISLTIQLHKLKKWDALKISALFGMYGFFIAYGFESIVFIVEIATAPPSLWDNQSFATFQFLFWNLWYTLSWSSFYIFMILRIKNTFNDTHSVYSLNLKILYLHFIIAIIPPILIIIGVFNVDVYKILSVVWICITFFGAFHLIYKFNHNLYLLILSQNQGGDEAKLNQTQENMIRTVTKHTVLGGMILVCLALCAFTHTWGPLFAQFWVGILLIHIGVILISLSGLGIYLSFNFNKKTYLKLCRPWDDCTNMSYTKRAKNNNEERNSPPHSQKRAMSPKSPKEVKYAPVNKTENGTKF